MSQMTQIGQEPNEQNETKMPNETAEQNEPNEAN